MSEKTAMLLGFDCNTVAEFSKLYPTSVFVLHSLKGPSSASHDNPGLFALSGEQEMVVAVRAQATKMMEAWSQIEWKVANCLFCMV